MKQESWFNEVYTVVKMIPVGRVMTYGQVAAMAGKPQGARAVGWALGLLEMGTNVPWWRVVNAQGYLSIRGHDFISKERQAELLALEDVFVNPDLHLDLTKYRWHGQ